MTDRANNRTITPRRRRAVLAVAAGAGLASLSCGDYALYEYYFYNVTGIDLLAAGLVIALTALAVLAARVIPPAPRIFWRLAALGVALLAALAAGSCA